MRRLLRLLRTSIGQKFLMAITGALLIGFLIAHVLGNLLVFKGPEPFNDYADYLKGHPLLWFFRAGLLALFVTHIFFGVMLFRENRQARGGRYAVEVTRRSSLASRSMMITGLILLAFVVYHLWHFTVSPGWRGQTDVYRVVTDAFRDPWHMALYVAAMLFLGSHLIHGVASTFQTLGLNHEIYNPIIRVFAWALVALLVIGFCSIPLAIYLFPTLFTGSSPAGGGGS